MKLLRQTIRKLILEEESMSPELEAIATIQKGL